MQMAHLTAPATALQLSDAAYIHDDDDDESVTRGL
jgi:hypothetical protein